MEAIDVDQLLASDPARRSIAALGCMAASVAAVVTVLSVPGWLASTGGPSQPLPSVPTALEETIGTRSWAAQECQGETPSCPVPSVLGLAGARFRHVGGHQQPVRQRDIASRTLVTTVEVGPGRRWLLVGALGTSSASVLSVQLGSGDAAVLLPGTLTFLSLPGHPQHLQVKVSDYGRPSAHEVLRVEEYAARG